MFLLQSLVSIVSRGLHTSLSSLSLSLSGEEEREKGEEEKEEEKGEEEKEEERRQRRLWTGMRCHGVNSNGGEELLQYAALPSLRVVGAWSCTVCLMEL